jgi:hypothetical protein
VRLLKLGAQVRVSVRRVWIAFSESFPAQGLFLTALRNIQASAALPAARCPLTHDFRPIETVLRRCPQAAPTRAVASAKTKRPRRPQIARTVSLFRPARHGTRPTSPARRSPPTQPPPQSPRKPTTKPPGERSGLGPWDRRSLARHRSSAVQPRTGSMAQASRTPALLSDSVVGGTDVGHQSVLRAARQPLAWLADASPESGEGTSHIEVGARAQHVMAGPRQLIRHLLDTPPRRGFCVTGPLASRAALRQCF